MKMIINATRKHSKMVYIGTVDEIVELTVNINGDAV